MLHAGRLSVFCTITEFYWRCQDLSYTDISQISKHILNTLSNLSTLGLSAFWGVGLQWLDSFAPSLWAWTPWGPSESFTIPYNSMFHQVSTFNILQLHCNAKSNFYTRLKLLRHFRIGFSANLACSQLFQHRRKSRCKSCSVDTVCYNSISIMLPCSIDSSSVTKPDTWKSTEYARMKLLESERQIQPAQICTIFQPTEFDK